MKRTKIDDRHLPYYTRGEEIFNALSHLGGAALGAFALALMLFTTIKGGKANDIIGCSIYGASLVLLYSASGVYHALKVSRAKKIMQVVDHCSIYLLIAGTYSPILLSSVMKASPVCAVCTLICVWSFALLSSILTAIDLYRFSKFSMFAYISIGWSLLLIGKIAFSALGRSATIVILLGGAIYTLGTILYSLGRTHRYMHSLFHIFVLIGSALHFFAIFFFVI